MMGMKTYIIISEQGFVNYKHKYIWDNFGLIFFADKRSCELTLKDYAEDLSVSLVEKIEIHEIELPVVNL